MKNLFLIALCSSVVCAVSVWAATPAMNTSGQSAKPGSALERQLLDNLHQYIQAYTQKNLDYFKRTLTEDFLYVPKNGGTSNRAEFLEDVASPGTEKEPRTYNVKVVPLSDTVALLTYDEIDTGDQPRYRHITQVWLKQGDQWKLKFLQTTPNTWSIGDTD